jgi:hypothetical protein
MPPSFDDVTWESIRTIFGENSPSWLRSPRINDLDSLDSTTYLYRANSRGNSVMWRQVVEMLRSASDNANLEFDEEDNYTLELEPSDELDAYLSGIRVIEARKD